MIKRAFLELLPLLILVCGCTASPDSALVAKAKPEWLLEQKELWSQAVTKLPTGQPVWPSSTLKSASLVGDRLLWISEGEGASELWTAKLQSGATPLSKATRLLRREYPDVLLTVSLSPDQKRAILQTQNTGTVDPENRCTVELLELGGGKPRALTMNGSRYFAPAWCGNDACLLAETETGALTVFRQDLPLTGRTADLSRQALFTHRAPYARLVLQSLEPEGWMAVDRNQPQDLHCWLTSRADAVGAWTELKTPGHRARPMGWYQGKMLVVVRDSREQSRVLLVDPPPKITLEGEVLLSTGPIEYAFLSGSTLFYLGLDRWGHKLMRLDLASKVVTPLELPFTPVHGAAFQPSGPGRALLPLQGPFQPQSFVLVSTEPPSIRPLLMPGLEGFRREDFEVETTDGRIRIAPKSRTKDGPVLLESYGAFGESLAPIYDPFRLQWLRLGGDIVIAHLKGAPKQQDRVIDELLLAAREFSTVIYRGQSFGATLGLMAMQRDPKAFDAVLADAALTDLVHFADRPPGELWTSEIGDANLPEDKKKLLRLSPFHNLKKTVYPPTVLTHSAEDPIVCFEHSTAYVQKAQSIHTGNLTLLHIQKVGAHDRLRPFTSEQVALANLLWSFVDSRSQDGVSRTAP